MTDHPRRLPPFVDANNKIDPRKRIADLVEALPRGAPKAATQPLATTPTAAPKPGKRRAKLLTSSGDKTLPYWPDTSRAIPNDMARSALFSARRRGARVQYKNHTVASLSNTDIRYTGEELRQVDEDVFLQLCHAARGAAIEGSIVEISFKSGTMRAALGWPHNGDAYRQLAESIERLAGCLIHIMVDLGDETRSYGGHLINSAARRYLTATGGTDDNDDWVVTFDARMVNFFSPGAYSRIEWRERSDLTSELARWLHTFYSTHRSPFPMFAEKLWRLSGSGARYLGEFRRLLRGALDDLARVGFLVAWQIDDTDKVHVTLARGVKSVVKQPDADAG